MSSKDQSVNILAGNGFPKSPQAYCITQGTCGVHVGELTGLLWGVNVGVNMSKYCEMKYSHLRQRACPDSPGPVLQPEDVWEIPGYFYPSCSGVQGAVKSKTLLLPVHRGGPNPTSASYCGCQRVTVAVCGMWLRSMGHFLGPTRW